MRSIFCADTGQLSRHHRRHHFAGDKSAQSFAYWLVRPKVFKIEAKNVPVMQGVLNEESHILHWTHRYALERKNQIQKKGRPLDGISRNTRQLANPGDWGKTRNLCSSPANVCVRERISHGDIPGEGTETFLFLCLPILLLPKTFHNCEEYYQHHQKCKPHRPVSHSAIERINRFRGKICHHHAVSFVIGHGTANSPVGIKRF